MPDPVVPPTSENPPSPNSQPAPAPQNDEANKFRRLFEDKDKEAKALTERLAALEDAEKKRKDAELSDLEKERKRAEEAEKEAKALKQENLRRKVASEKGLPTDAIDLLSGDDEAAITATAERLKSLMGTSANGTPPPAGGSTTQPPSNQEPDIDAKIAAAEKAGNALLAIRLKRQKAGRD